MENTILNMEKSSIFNLDALLKSNRVEEKTEIIWVNRERDEYLEIKDSGFEDSKRMTFYAQGKVVDAMVTKLSVEEIKEKLSGGHQ